MNVTPGIAYLEGVGYHEALGLMIWLMKHAQYHSQWPVWSVDNDIVPALLHEQFRLYSDNNGKPAGFATWAWLDDSAREQLLANEEPLEVPQWNSGLHLLFADFVAPWGHTRSILTDLRTNVFPTHRAFSLRRSPDGSIRKIDYWKGVEFNEAIAEEQRTMNKKLLGWK